MGNYELRQPSGLSFARDNISTSPETDIRMIQDYFGQTVGSIKKVLLQYGPTGRSRGIATIIFGKPDAGAEAARKLDGVKVDNKPMRVSNKKQLQSRLVNSPESDRNPAGSEASTSTEACKGSCRPRIVSTQPISNPQISF